MMLRKGLAVAVILLFIGMSVFPSTGNRVAFDDITPPVTTCTLNPPEPNGNNNWYVSDVEVTLNATDDMSGVNVTQFRVDGGSIQTYTELFNVTADGVHTVEYRSVDYAGNIEDWKSVEFAIDQTPPTIDITWELYCENGTWYLTIGVIYDDATSGVDYVEFYINDALMFVDNTPPFEMGWIITSKYSVKGLICGRQFDEQNVAFYALIVKIKQYWQPSYTVSVAVYDFAGNVIKEEIKFDVPPIIRIYLLKRLTFANNYTGRVGIFFINAEFEEGPL